MISFGNFCLLDSRMFAIWYLRTLSPYLCLTCYVEQSIVNEVHPIALLEQIMLLLCGSGFKKD